MSEDTVPITSSPIVMDRVFSSSTLTSNVSFSDDQNDSDQNDYNDNDNANDYTNTSLSDDQLDMQQLLKNFQDNEPIFDNELLYPTPKESIIVHFKDNQLITGTVESLITYMTSPFILNYQFLIDFFLTFRSYIDSLPLLELLLCRLSWCLKKSLSNDLNEMEICKLVLIRTFVTIRHWLLNHFQDDFINNLTLRTLFANTINELPKYKEFIGNGNEISNLQSKIIKDLKKNYLTLSKIYWNSKIDNVEDIDDILNYKLSSYEDFDNSRLSVLGISQLYDPSSRRSTLLNMLENPNINNSQSNLLNDSSDRENPLENYLKRQNRQNNSRKERNNHNRNNSRNNNNNNNENLILFPKDSINALDLKKFKSSSTTFDSSSIDQLYSSITESNSKNGFISLNKHKSGSLNLNGFSISGNIEIFNDSKINKIESLVNELPKRKVNKPMEKESEPELEMKKTKVEIKTLNKSNKVADIKENQKKPKKKGFLKQLFTHNNSKDTKENKENEPLIKRKEPIQQKPIIKRNKSPKKPAISDMIKDLEDKILINDSKIDYLEEIVIRDYKIMISKPNFRKRYSKQIKNSNRKSILSMGFDLTDNESKFDPNDSPIKINKNKYYEGQLENSMNIRQINQNTVNEEFSRVNNENEVEEEEEYNNDENHQDDVKSFQTPPNTTNWSDSMIINDSTNLNTKNEFIDMGLINRNSTKSLSRPNTNTNIRKSFHNLPNSTTISTSSKRNKYNSDPNLLMKQTIIKSGFINILNSSVNNTNISYESFSYNYDSYSLGTGVFANNVNNFNNQLNITGNNNISNNNSSTAHNSMRYSVNIIGGRNSIVSNRSYITYDSEFSSSSKVFRNNNNNEFDNKLRKKGAVLNLRNENDDVINNDLNNDVNDDDYEDEDISNNYDNDNSLDDESNLETESNINIDNLKYIQELPFFENNIEQNRIIKKSGISILPSPTASQTCYNDFSQKDINELANLPDEKINDDPLNYTLSKLRGDRKQPTVIIGLNDDVKLDEAEIHRKHAVAVVCQSPTKKQPIMSNINDTLHDYYQSSDNDTNEEIILENRIKDLYISANPNDTDNRRPSLCSNNKLEMNMISTQSFSKMRDNGSIHTKVSTGKLLRNDSERSMFDIQSLFATPKGLDNITPLIPITDVINNELHIPFIFKYDSDILAKQMTLIERDIISEVEWKELINLKWNQPLTPYNSWLKLLVDISDKSGLELITLRFNLVNNWIISEVLLCKNIILRILTITRFIQLAIKCREYQNYGTLFQIMLALNSDVMKELKSTWIRIDPLTILKFKELKDLTSPINNFKNYRDEIEKIKPSKGFIPFLPLSLSDLTMYSEMPTIISSNNGDLSTELDSLDGFGSESVINYELVNFEKFTITGETVKKTLRHIEWSKFYNFEKNDEVISKCLYISSLSEEDMEKCLIEIGDNNV